MCLRRLNRKEQQPFVFYIHPWELDPAQPRIDGAARLAYFRHSVNIHKTEAKLEHLLSTFRFGPISEVVAQTQNHTPSSKQAAVSAQNSLHACDCSGQGGVDR